MGGKDLGCVPRHAIFFTQFPAGFVAVTGTAGPEKEVNSPAVPDRAVVTLTKKRRMCLIMGLGTLFLLGSIITASYGIIKKSLPWYILSCVIYYPWIYYLGNLPAFYYIPFFEFVLVVLYLLPLIAIKLNKGALAWIIWGLVLPMPIWALIYINVNRS
ncbi:hypothetical protein [Desulfofundulus thermocisternus]|uniref:hypothetical protein n=1 Tax=Desulfofundulus thermocisternus TaxID=42471 RepID=UPI00138DF42A|nr:hypothetical protein [Desulfofundulus thermocisternus]